MSFGMYYWDHYHRTFINPIDGPWPLISFSEHLQNFLWLQRIIREPFSIPAVVENTSQTFSESPSLTTPSEACEGQAAPDYNEAPAERDTFGIISTVWRKYHAKKDMVDEEDAIYETDSGFDTPGESFDCSTQSPPEHHVQGEAVELVDVFRGKGWKSHFDDDYARLMNDDGAYGGLGPGLTLQDDGFGGSPDGAL